MKLKELDFFPLTCSLETKHQTRKQGHEQIQQCALYSAEEFLFCKVKNHIGNIKLTMKEGTKSELTGQADIKKQKNKTKQKSQDYYESLKYQPSKTFFPSGYFS